MKRIRQAALYYQAHRSDKVYEVDICAVVQDKYIVNFRYGRRGKVLKESSKTLFPVSLEKANQIFDKLVAAKKRKGYLEGTPGEPVQAVSEKTPFDLAQAKTYLLARLQQPQQKQAVKKGDLKRAIWRAGEWGLKAAVPPLLERLRAHQDKDEMLLYVLLAALGRCGTAELIPEIQPYFQKPISPTIQRIAREALLQLSDQPTRDAFAQDMQQQLPLGLLKMLKLDGEAQTAALLSYFEAEPTQLQHLETLYLTQNKAYLSALAQLLQQLPLRPPAFKWVRALYKIAEYRRDGVFLALLHRRFEAEKPLFNNHNAYFWGVTVAGVYYPKPKLQKELKRPDSKLAYGSKTRHYLLRRTWRTLRRLAELESPDFVALAHDFLLAYTDADAQPPRETRTTLYDYKTRGYLTRHAHYDAWAPYLTLNQLLYRQSPRYTYAQNNRAWRCQATQESADVEATGDKPGDAVLAGREEAFPHLWDRAPEQLLSLVQQSTCAPVQHFAARALLDHPEFCAEQAFDIWLPLLNSPYETTAALAFETLKPRYPLGKVSDNMQLLRHLSRSVYAPARRQACDWFKAQAFEYLQSADLMAAFLLSPHAEVSDFMLQTLKAATLSEADILVLLKQVFATLQSEASAAVPSESRLVVLCEQLQTLYTSALTRLSLDTLLPLLEHPVQSLQTLAAQSLLQHQVPPEAIPEPVFYQLLNAAAAELRQIGIALFVKLPDATAPLRIPLYHRLCVHEAADMRAAVTPVLVRLSQSLPRFIMDLGQVIYQDIFAYLYPAEVNASVVNLFQGVLAPFAETLSLEQIQLLIWEHPDPVLQEWGGRLIMTRDRGAQVELVELVRWAGHEVLAVRQAAWQALSQRLPQLQGQPEALAQALKCLESPWEDSRQFAFALVREQLTEADLTPDVIVSICDSVREDVQRFGRELVTTYFKGEQGAEYLLKLSEHPTQTMQLFTTNWLPAYLRGEPERIQRLSWYFASVLTRVNQAGLAKKRVLEFLASEARHHPGSARVIVAILTPISATQMVELRACILEIFVAIHQTFPDIPLPLRLREPEVRCAV